MRFLTIIFLVLWFICHGFLLCFVLFVVVLSYSSSSFCFVVVVLCVVVFLVVVFVVFVVVFCCCCFVFVCCCCCFFGGRGLGVISKEPLFSVFSTIYLSLQKVQGLLTCEAARLHIISRNLAAAAPHQRDIFTSVCIILLCQNSGCQCFRIFCREHRLVLMYVLMYVIATRGWGGGGGLCEHGGESLHWTESWLWAETERCDPLPHWGTEELPLELCESHGGHTPSIALEGRMS